MYFARLGYRHHLGHHYLRYQPILCFQISFRGNRWGLCSISPSLILTCTPCEQIIPQLLIFPIGKAWVRYVPNATFFGTELNPGPFTIKEHVIATVIAWAGVGSDYAVSTKFS